MFNINLHFVILSTQTEQSSQYILSLDGQDIEFPSIHMDDKLLQNLDNNIMTYVQSKYLPETSYYDLIPQLISLNTNELKINNNESTINTIYGFVVPYTTTTINSKWFKFNYLETHKYNKLIFEVIQKLK